MTQRALLAVQRAYELVQDGVVALLLTEIDYVHVNFLLLEPLGQFGQLALVDHHWARNEQHDAWFMVLALTVLQCELNTNTNT